MKKNARKTERRRRGTGHRDTERFPTEFGPPRGIVNFYGHFSPRRAARMRAVAAKLRGAESVEAKSEILSLVPRWLSRLVAGR